MFWKTTTFAAMAITASMATGCAIHAQAPIKEVAYDFSDRDFYDRSYAPSPAYGDATPPSDKSEHAKAKHADDDDSDDGDQQVVVVVGHGGKVTVDQGGGRHRRVDRNQDDDDSDPAPRPSRKAPQVVVNDQPVQAQAPIPVQPQNPAPQPAPQRAPAPVVAQSATPAQAPGFARH
jgi:hypothetical protein